MKPSVGRIVHLAGEKVGAEESVCVPAIVTEVDGDDLYATPFTSPRTWVAGPQPYIGEQWHWPERVE